MNRFHVLIWVSETLGEAGNINLYVIHGFLHYVSNNSMLSPDTNIKALLHATLRWTIVNNIYQ